MSLIKPHNDCQSRSSELRSFGFVMTFALIAWGGLLMWLGNSTSLYLFLVAMPFLGGAIYCPLVLGPVERAWLCFGRGMSAIMTRVIMVLTFYGAITPLGLLMRFFRRDQLKLKFDREADTYWLPVEDDGPGTRYFLPY